MSGARTEDPTPRRLRRAREEGDSGASTFATQTLGLVAALALLPVTVVAVVERVEERLRDAIGRAASPDPALVASSALTRSIQDVALLSLPVLAGVAVVTAATSLIQSGGFAGVRLLSPRLDRLNPFSGRLMTRARLFGVARALAGGAIVAWVVVHQLRVHAGDIARTSGRLALAGPAAADIARTIAWNVAFAGLAIAALDVVVMRLDRLRRLRMSRDEAKRERREAEGDPVAKEARERARNAMVVAGAIGDVRRAAVVVRDGARSACALRYDEGDDVPRVAAVGRGEEAEGIVREARAYGVPVVEDVEVARALVDKPAGDASPETLYDAVAEILRNRG